jgi:quinol monooxygenase YgiN
MAAVQVHLSVPESREFLAAIGAMAVAPPVMRIFAAEEISES